MNPFNLRNNALFLSCWHERTRPVQLICFFVVLSSILLLMCTIVSKFSRAADEMAAAYLAVFVVIQALIFLVQGTLCAAYIGSREKISGTLDFHRNSPESVRTKIFGLIFGSTWLEWAVFAGLMLIQIPFVWMAEVPWFNFLLWNVSIIMTGLFFHTVGLSLSMLSAKKSRGSAIGILMLIIFLGGPFILAMMEAFDSSLIVYLLGMNAIVYLIQDVDLPTLGYFYWFRLPNLLIQILVQMPIVVLLLQGLSRVFQKPNSPVWSKTHILVFCGYIFACITGFLVAEHNFNPLFRSHSYSRFNQPGDDIFFYIIFYAIVGFLICGACVPSYFKLSKFFALRGSGLIQGVNIMGDGASSVFVLLMYILMGCVFVIPYALIGTESIARSVLAIGMTSLYIAIFAGFLEYFRLSPLRNNRIFFVTVIGVAWIIIPWVSVIMFTDLEFGMETLGGISPFGGIGMAIATLADGLKSEYMTAMIIPIIMLGIIWTMVYHEHQRVKLQSLSLQ